MEDPNNIDTDGDPKRQERSKPRDGPPTVFEVDPVVSDIFTGKDGDYFGLVLVTNWPVSPLAEMDGPYQDFLTAVKSCFQNEDISVPSKATVSLPAVYLYPTIYLHITLATFVRPTKIISDNNNESKDLRQAKKEGALELVRSASKLPGWPTEPLQLVVDKAQIGKSAGILLWKDLSGGVAAIRNCLRRASAEVDASANDNDTPATTTIVPTIPWIIHSTFLRFSSAPQTPGEKLQEAFRSRVQEKLGKEFFRTAADDGTTPFLQADTVRLVCESSPYMHLPNDDEHVLWTCELTK
jgi:hypothetical protein